MSFDVDKLSPRARQRYIRIGRSFGSDDTLQQANNTLQAWNNHKSNLTGFGFQEKDAKKLEAVRDLLRKANTSRESVKTVRKQGTKSYVASIKAGQRLRERARILLKAVLEDLEEVGTDKGLVAADLVESQLEKTSQASSEADSLATQLELLIQSMQHADTKTVADARGGATLATEIQSHCKTLRAQADTRILRPGTPEHTELLDTLDGVIVTLSRRAREAAESASKTLKQPAILSAFHLNALYTNSPSSEAEDENSPAESNPTPNEPS